MNYYIISAFIIAFIWGLSPVLFRYIIKNQQIPVYIIIFIQAFVYFCSSVIYIYFHKYHSMHNDLYEHKNYIPYLIIISFFSVYIANILYIYALETHVNINIIILITSLYPVITIIFAYFILQERMTINTIIGFIFTPY